jgi:ribonuclease HI
MKTLRFFHDGGANPTNPGPSAAGVYFPDLRYGIGQYLGDLRTNNEAELCALVLAYRFAHEHSYDSLEGYGDSKLAINLALGVWKTSVTHLDVLVSNLKYQLAKFPHTLTYVPRKLNATADFICNEIINRQRQGEDLRCPTKVTIPSSIPCTSLPI